MKAGTQLIEKYTNEECVVIKRAQEHMVVKFKKTGVCINDQTK